MIIREAIIKDFNGVYEIMHEIFELHFERRQDIYRNGIQIVLNLMPEK